VASGGSDQELCDRRRVDDDLTVIIRLIIHPFWMLSYVYKACLLDSQISKLSSSCYTCLTAHTTAPTAHLPTQRLLTMSAYLTYTPSLFQAPAQFYVNTLLFAPMPSTRARVVKFAEPIATEYFDFAPWSTVDEAPAACSLGSAGSIPALACPPAPRKSKASVAKALKRRILGVEQTRVLDRSRRVLLADEVNGVDLQCPAAPKKDRAYRTMAVKRFLMGKPKVQAVHYGGPRFEL
jgi:hypothetical protein